MTEVMAKLDYRIVEPTQENIGALYGKFHQNKEHFPDSLLDLSTFIEIMTAGDSVLYEVGDFAGVVYFTDVCTPEDVPMGDAIAQTHIFLWDKDYLGKSVILRKLGLDFMARFGIHRLFAEIPPENVMATRLAELVGFKRVGVLRERERHGDKMVDSQLFDALQSDLRQAGD